MSGERFKGASVEQDGRFMNKKKKLLKTLKFGDNFSEKVDLSKVKLDVLKPWIAKRATELTDVEDEVLIEYILSQLDTQFPDPKDIQINLTGFMNSGNARRFMTDLWTKLLDAQSNPTGIPTVMIDEKKQTLIETAKKEKIKSQVKAIEEELIMRQRAIESLVRQRHEKSSDSKISNEINTTVSKNEDKAKDALKSLMRRPGGIQHKKRKLKNIDETNVIKKKGRKKKKKLPDDKKNENINCDINDESFIEMNKVKTEHSKEPIFEGRPDLAHSKSGCLPYHFTDTSASINESLKLGNLMRRGRRLKNRAVMTIDPQLMQAAAPNSGISNDSFNSIITAKLVKATGGSGRILTASATSLNNDNQLAASLRINEYMRLMSEQRKAFVFRK